MAVFPAQWLSLYYRIDHLDKLFHFIGGLIVVWFFSICLNNKFSKLPVWEKLIALLTVIFLVGLFWEFLEYISGSYLKNYWPILGRYFYIGNLRDSLGDLTADVMGGLVFSLVYLYRIAFVRPKQPRHFDVER